MNNRQLKTANVLRRIARFGLLGTGVLVFAFALVSGSEAYGGGVSGILQNAPNALPWAALLLLTGMAWKWERVGGMVVTLFGIGLVIFFNFTGHNFFVVTFILTMLIVILGVLFLLSSYLRTVKS